MNLNVLNDMLDFDLLNGSKSASMRRVSYSISDVRIT